MLLMISTCDDKLLKSYSFDDDFILVKILLSFISLKTLLNNGLERFNSFIVNSKLLFKSKIPFQLVLSQFVGTIIKSLNISQFKLKSSVVGG